MSAEVGFRDVVVGVLGVPDDDDDDDDDDGVLAVPRELHLQHIGDEISLELDEVLLLQRPREIGAKEIPDQARCGGVLHQLLWVRLHVRHSSQNVHKLLGGRIVYLHLK